MADVPFTITFIGCGNVGRAILRGLLTKLEEQQAVAPKRIIACVTRSESAEKLRAEFANKITVLEQSNVGGAQQANAVLLSCPTSSASTVLSEPGMKEALRGKLMLSILAGVPASRLYADLYGSTSSTPTEMSCTIVRAMPNAASSIGESITIIERTKSPLSPEDSAFINWLFSSIGRVVLLKPHLMSAGTALGGAGPAFCALILEALVEGGLALGLERDDAQMMAAQAMRGASGLVLSGDTPSGVRERISTPGGCTVGGLQVLEEGAIRAVISRAIRQTASISDAIGRSTEN